MPKFRVPIVRERIASKESTEVHVVARTKIEAAIKAMDDGHDEDLHWQQLEIERGHEYTITSDIEKIEKVK